MKKRVLSLLSVMALLCTMVAGMTFGTASAEEVVMKPGMSDWVEAGEAYVDVPSVPETGGVRYTSANGTLGHIGVEPTNGSYTTYVQDTAGQQMGDMQNTTFFGKKLTGAVSTDATWSGAYIQYKVQGGTYAATALPVHHWSSPFGNDGEDYGFWTSADGATWTRQTPTLSAESTCGALTVHKAVVKIPADANYYRVILPGAQSNDPATPSHWYQGDPVIYWTNFIGPSVFSAYDLTQYKTLEEIPEWDTSVLYPGDKDWMSISDEQLFEDTTGTYDSNYGILGSASPQFLAEHGMGKIHMAISIRDASGHNQFANITAGKFFGEPITNYAATNWGWAGGFIRYTVQPGSYVATALPVQHESAALVEKYRFEVSADGSAWTPVTADISIGGYGISFNIYKAVVKIPDDAKYYRVIIAGMQDGGGWHNGADDWWWRVAIGPSLASAYDLSKYDTLADIPDFAEYKQLENLGGQVRLGATKDLRFGFKLDADNVGYEDPDHADANYKRALTADSKVYVDGKAYTVTDFGALLSGYSDAELNDVNARNAVKVSAENLFDVAENGDVTYTVVVTNIGDNQVDTKIYARPYVEYLDEAGQTQYAYGEKIDRCWSECNPDGYAE